MSVTPSWFFKDLRPTRPGWAFTAAALFSMAAAGAFFWSHSWAGGARATASAPASLEDGQAQNSMHAAAAKERVREMKAYWHSHKARLTQLLTVDYPAALAKRNAASPGLANVVRFGADYGPGYERGNKAQFLRAQEQFDQHKAKLQELQAQGRGVPDELMFYARTLADNQPVAAGVTVSDLARDFTVDDPNGLARVRNLAAATERRTFQDEATAKRVEAMQSPQEMLTYLQGALPRWETEQAHVYTEAGIDEEAARYGDGIPYTYLLGTVTRAYADRRNAELAAIGKESDAMLQAMDVPLLASSSRDDPESRHLLTELKDLILLRQQQKTQL